MTIAVREDLFMSERHREDFERLAAALPPGKWKDIRRLAVLFLLSGDEELLHRLTKGPAPYFNVPQDWYHLGVALVDGVLDSSKAALVRLAEVFLDDDCDEFRLPDIWNQMHGPDADLALRAIRVRTFGLRA